MTTGDGRRRVPSGDMLLLVLVSVLLAGGGIARLAGPVPADIL
jgi:hypothetical protein